jgi:hypothetical protein
MAEKEGLGAKVKKYKGALQAAVDRKAQEIADYGFQKGQELEAQGYPRLGAAAANTGAGVAALGSTAAGEALDYVPESGADAAMLVMGPAGKLAKKGGRLLKIADEGEKISKGGSTWTKVKTAAEEAADLSAAKEKVKGLGGETSNAAMSQLREALRKQGKNEMEIDNTLRSINNATQYGAKK